MQAGRGWSVFDKTLPRGQKIQAGTKAGFADGELSFCWQSGPAFGQLIVAQEDVARFLESG
ncbi:hypothetical protein [Paludibacterium denitrificans]|uniref:hypothetical protein n=1 Tax=Paludibacterium denitrificans TaxID=2675226 RepID=UPI001E51BDCC|nr:hypothetical protein [Paludibacterium denitrificans]